MKSIVSLLLACCIFFGCRNKNIETEPVDPVTSLGNSTITFAQGFALKKTGQDLLLTVKNPWQHASGIEFSYLLSDSAKASSKIGDHSWIIKTPVRKVICLSTTHIGFVDKLGEIRSIRGISGKNLVVNPEIRKGILKGSITDVGYDENLNYELILKIAPDVVFVYGVGVEITNTVRKLNDLGIPTMLIGEYLEEEPLAKTEWIKVFGACFGKLSEAALTFDSTVTRYVKLKNTAGNSRERPTVLLGLPWRGNWYVSGSKSYIARLIKDAGAKYVWDQLDFNESRPMSLEKIYEKALTVDLWVNTGDALTSKDILSVDERFGKLPVFINKSMYNNNNMLSETGGNAFYESGVVEPDVILEDLICIFHPQLLPSHRLKYYRKLP
jgi:iron complex transport system substrate-binding protein